MSDSTNCPNCNIELKSGLLSSVKLLSNSKINVINEYTDSNSTGYCTKCGKEKYNEAINKLKGEKDEIVRNVTLLVESIPVITVHSPLNWDYDILELATGQSTTGTGLLTELTSSVNDLFGNQSGRHNVKLRGGENNCKAQLRKQALDAGGNAIIGIDLDYSEVGGEKAMLMVCMSGTVIRLKNLSVLGEKREQDLSKLSELNDRLKMILDIESN